MEELQQKTDRLYHELDNAVAEIEKNHPDALEEIQACKAKVAEFRRYIRPRTYGEFLTLSQAQTVYKMGIHSIRGSLDRNKAFDQRSSK